MSRPPESDERLLELARDWRGRLRRLRWPAARRRLPLWAQVGLSGPRSEWALVLVACACALAGGALIALAFAPNGAR